MVRNVLRLYFFVLCRYPRAVDRTAAMSGHAHGVAGGCSSRAPRLLPPPCGGGVRLQQEPGQAGQKPPAATQGAETEVSVIVPVISTHLDNVGWRILMNNECRYKCINF